MDNYTLVAQQDSTLQEIEQLNQINGLLDEIVENNNQTTKQWLEGH